MGRVEVLRKWKGLGMRIKPHGDEDRRPIGSSCEAEQPAVTVWNDFAVVRDTQRTTTNHA